MLRLNLEMHWLAGACAQQLLVLLSCQEEYPAALHQMLLLLLPVLCRALVNVGAALRLRRVIADLQAGKNVSVGVIGGSISW